VGSVLCIRDSILIMRDGRIIQTGRPEDLVGAPADDYVADFVRDVPKSHVLTLRWIMRPPRPDDPIDGPEFPPDSIIRTALHAAAGTAKPIRVVEDGRVVGVIDRAQILEAVSGSVASLERDVPDTTATEAGNGR
jgi:glycine betaine/proline transport system ATP-binding protein